MKVKWKKEMEFLLTVPNQIYEVVDIKLGWYHIVDEDGEDYLYPPEMFDVVEE